VPCYWEGMLVVDLNSHLTGDPSWLPEPWQIAIGLRCLTSEEYRQRLDYFERKAQPPMPPEVWQQAIGQRLLTPAEQEARDRHFAAQARRALERLYTRRRMSRLLSA
jgi:hypothetical protein